MTSLQGIRFTGKHQKRLLLALESLSESDNNWWALTVTPFLWLSELQSTESDEGGQLPVGKPC